MVNDSLYCRKCKGGDVLRKKIIMIFSAVLMVLTLIAIWRFSAQSAADSSALSGHLAEIINDNPWLNQVMDVDILEAILRKLAHGFVYLILGIGMTGVMVMQPMRLTLLLVPLTGIFFAALDELHQSFVPGRGPAVRDVLIDAVGVCLGMFLMMLLRQIYRHFSRKRILAR